jgi:hypothetical protein
MNTSVVGEFPSTKSIGNTAAIRSERGNSLGVPLNSEMLPTADQLRSQSEAFLDTSINVAFTRLIGGATKEERVEAWEEFAGLIRQRSPQHVARLEQEKFERIGIKVSP